VVLPAIQKIGVGWFSTISAMFLVVSTFFVYLTARFGKGWRDGIDEKKAACETASNETEK